jgi:hypothetical protein
MVATQILNTLALKDLLARELKVERSWYANAEPISIQEKMSELEKMTHYSPLRVDQLSSVVLVVVA